MSLIARKPLQRPCAAESSRFSDLNQSFATASFGTRSQSRNGNIQDSLLGREGPRNGVKYQAAATPLRTKERFGRSQHKIHSSINLRCSAAGRGFPERKTCVAMPSIKATHAREAL